MPKYSQDEKENYRKKLFTEFVQKFDAQPPEGRLRFEKHLIIAPGLSASTLSRAFANARELEKKEAERIPADAACATAYDYLTKYWQASDECVFAYIGELPQEEPIEATVIARERFPQEVIFKALADCKGDIRIIDTYPSFLRTDQDHPDEINFLNWTKQSGRKLKLLVLDPTGHGIDLRLNSAINKPLLFEMTIDTFRRQLVSVFQELLEFSTEHPELLEVKLMNELPAIHGILMPNRVFFGFHFSHRLSHKASFVEIQGANCLSTDLGQHFEKIWNESQSSFSLDQILFDKIKRVMEQKNHSWDSFVGNWEVYFQDKWQEDRSSPLSKISKADLEIDPPLNNAPMSARLYFWDAQLDRLQKFDGNVRFERLTDSEFAFLVFSNHENVSIRLIVRCKLDANNDALLGHWALTNAYDLNTSAIVLKKNSDQGFPAPKFNIPFKDVPSEVLNALAFRNQYSFSLAEFANKYKATKEGAGLEMYEGTYKMYAYVLGRNKDEKLKKGIQLNQIHISSFGFVRYKSIKSTSFGVASVKDDNLYLTLTDDERDYRVGHFIFYTNDIKIEKDGVYTGIFLGISFRNRLPVARRVVLVKSDETFEGASPSFIVANSEEYQLLHKGLKKALSGRIKNLIGFLRSSSGIFSLAELYREWEGGKIFEENEFFEFACKYALEEDKEKAILLLDRAVEFGFFDIERFEEKIVESKICQEILKDAQYKAIKERISNSE